MEDEDVFDKLAAVIAGTDKGEFIAALVEHKIWDDVRDRAVEDAARDGDVVMKVEHDDEVNELNAELDKLQAEVDAVAADGERIHEAICEGRRQDAIDLLRDITNLPLRSVREQANLFPQRVAA